MSLRAPVDLAPHTVHHYTISHTPPSTEHHYYLQVRDFCPHTTAPPLRGLPSCRRQAWRAPPLRPIELQRQGRCIGRRLMLWKRSRWYLADRSMRRTGSSMAARKHVLHHPKSFMAVDECADTHGSWPSYLAPSISRSPASSKSSIACLPGLLTRRVLLTATGSPTPSCIHEHLFEGNFRRRR